MPAVIAFIVDIWTFFRVILLTNTLIIDETFWHIFRVKNLLYWCNFSILILSLNIFIYKKPLPLP